jgi:hypothetical protein
MSGWRDHVAVPRAPGGQALRAVGDLAPHDVATRWLYLGLLAGLVGGLLFALVVLSLPGAPVAARRAVLTFAAGAGALAAVAGAALGRPWAVLAALALLAGAARDGRPPRWSPLWPVSVVILVAVLAALEPASGLALRATGLALPSTGLALPSTGLALPASGLALPAIALALPGSVAAYAVARVADRRRGDVVTALTRDRLAPLIAAGLVLVAAGGFRAEPVAPPAPVMRSGAAADLTVSLTAAAGGVTILAASGRRPPPAPIDEVGLDLGGRAVTLLPTTTGRYAGSAVLPPAGSAVRATVTVRRAGERLTVPLVWTMPALPPTSSYPSLPVGGLLGLAVLGLAVIHRSRQREILEVTR